MKKRNLIIALVATSVVFGMSGCINKFSPQKFKDKMFAKCDTNGNGFIEKAEHTSMSEIRFKKADSNNDNKVSKEESAKTFMAKKFPAKAERNFIKGDTDKDGFVTHEEMKIKTDAKFKAQDTNADDKLSRDEMDKYRESQKLAK